jgi:hypothetical protein
LVPTDGTHLDERWVDRQPLLRCVDKRGRQGIAASEPGQSTDQFSDTPLARRVHRRDLAFERLADDVWCNAQQLTQELISTRHAYTDALQIGLLEVLEVIRNDELYTVSDGSREDMAILRIVGHLILDRLWRILVEHRLGKCREHRGSEPLPLLEGLCPSSRFFPTSSSIRAVQNGSKPPSAATHSSRPRTGSV